MVDLLIHLKNSFSYYEILNEEIEYKINTVLEEVCTITYTQFSGRGTKVAQEKPVFLYSLGAKKFPTGLLFEVLDALDAYTVTYEVLDERNKRIILNPFKLNLTFELDENQKTCLSFIGKNKVRGYFKLPTGAGKTAIIAGLIAETGLKTLVLEPSIDLVSQNSKELEKLTKKKVNIIQGGDSEIDGDYLITVASIDTLTEHLDMLKSIDWFSQFSMIIADEAHHANFTKAKTKTVDKKKIYLPPGTTGYYKVIMACENAHYRYGLTATDEGSETALRACFGKKLFEVTEDSLIEAGRISQPIILLYYLPVEFYDNEVDAFRFGIYENETRNSILVKALDTITECGGSVLFMLDSKKYQLNMIRDWVNYPIITGETKQSVRDKTYNDLREGLIKGIIMTVAKEGLNVPAVDAIIRASGKKSIRLVVQEKGRGSRVAEGKNTYLVLDFFDDDKYKKFYDPIKNRYKTKRGYLVKHSEERLAIYKRSKKADIRLIESEEELVSTIQEYFKDGRS